MRRDKPNEDQGRTFQARGIVYERTWKAAEALMFEEQQDQHW